MSAEEQRGPVEYVISEEEFMKPKELKPNKDRFRQIQVAKKKPIKNDDDEAPEEIDDDDYAFIQLSTDQKIFGKQVDLFVYTNIHPAIVQFEGYAFYPHHMAVTKFYPNGSLQHMLKEVKADKKSHPEWNGTMKSICVYGLVAAVNHIHNTHDEEKDDFSIRYLCPENIIFDSQNQPRLIHYVFGEEDLGKTPPAYIPPELYENPNGPRYDEDIWAIGMILYEILTGNQPYEGKSADQIKAAIMKGELPELPPKSKDTNHIIGIIQNCLDKNPLNRPLPYMLYHHLTSTSDDLFPDTNKNTYDNYRNKVQEKTLQSAEALKYEEPKDTSTSSGSETKDLLEKAEEGDSNALVRVGRMYQKGFGGFEKDEEKGFEYYMKAADDGYPVGMYNASLCLKQGRGCKKNLKKAFNLMKEAAENDLEKAVSEYGRMLMDGTGTEKDVKKAIKIFKKGDEKDYAECQYELASLYYDGCKELKKDISKAISLYKKAAQNGFAGANADLAYHYYKIGKEDDDEDSFKKAINLYKKAAAQRSIAAYLSLGRIYKEGKITEKNLKASAEYYKKAANLGDIEGMVDYGVCLKNGNGVKKDIKEAAKYYKKAALAGNKRGQHNYAKVLYDGEEVKQNLEEALEFFRKAADQEVPQSMFYCAKILINGEGVPKDIDEGKEYLDNYTKKVPKGKWVDGTAELIAKTKKK